MVDANGFHCRAPGQNRLASAAVAGKIVMYDGAREDDVVDIAKMFVDPDGGAA